MENKATLDNRNAGSRTGEILVIRIILLDPIATPTAEGKGARSGSIRDANLRQTVALWLQST